MDDLTSPTELALDWQDADEHQVRISVGACRLRLHPGDTGRVIGGTYDDPTGTLPLSVEQEHGAVRITQQTRLSDVRAFKAAVPTLDLGLGTGRPLSLHLATGASDAHLELGGLTLRRVSVRLGAGSAEISFAQPAGDQLEKFDCEAGAASVGIRGLGHASPESATVVGGAASYDLTFDGVPRRDVNAKVTTAGAAVVVRVPEETPARVGVVSILAGLRVDDGFQTWEDSFWTTAGVDGGRPLVSVDASITLGSLEIVGLHDTDDAADSIEASDDAVEPPGIEPGSR